MVWRDTKSSKEKGPRAINVVILGRPPRAPYIFFCSAIVVLTILSFFILLTYSTLNPLYAYALSINVATFILFTYDKGISNTSATRVPESVLYLAALIGGSVGLFLSQQFYRHKIKKTRFQFILLLIFTIQVVILRLFISRSL